MQLNEANHVEGHLAELDATVYWTYCEHQRDRFRYLGSALVAAVAAVALRMILVFFCFSGMIAEDSITCQRIDAETQTTYPLYSETAVAWR